MSGPQFINRYFLATLSANPDRIFSVERFGLGQIAVALMSARIIHGWVDELTTFVFDVTP